MPSKGSSLRLVGRVGPDGGDIDFYQENDYDAFYMSQHNAMDGAEGAPPPPPNPFPQARAFFTASHVWMVPRRDGAGDAPGLLGRQRLAPSGIPQRLAHEWRRLTPRVRSGVSLVRMYTLLCVCV